MGVEGVKWEDEGMSWVELRILEISGGVFDGGKAGANIQGHCLKTQTVCKGIIVLS